MRHSLRLSAGLLAAFSLAGAIEAAPAEPTPEIQAATLEARAQVLDTEAVFYSGAGMKPLQRLLAAQYLMRAREDRIAAATLRGQAGRLAKLH